MKYFYYLKPDANFDKFRKHRALISWLLNTRPDIARLSSKISQVTSKKFILGKVMKVNDAIKLVESMAGESLTYCGLDKSTTRLQVYTDASYATNKNLPSQLGTLVLLCNALEGAHEIYYCSMKSKRVVWSVMRAETYVFMDGFDITYSVARDFEVILNKSLFLYLYTDSKRLFDAITRGRRKTGRRLVVDIYGSRHSYEPFAITGMTLTHGADSLADGPREVRQNKKLS